MGRDLSRFWKEQVFVSLAAVVGTAFIGHALGVVSDNLVWKSATAGIVCYFGILLVRGWWASVKAPVVLDRRRQVEFDAELAKNSGYLSELNKGFADERGQWAKGVTDMNKDLSACREQLARKHPSDEVKEKYVREYFAKFDGMATALEAVDSSRRSPSTGYPRWM